MSRLNPFQVCTMKFELRDKTEEFVQFIKDGDGINYGGQRNLADYEIMLQDLEIKSSVSNHSMAVVRVVFRRQTGFHGITTFAQTMVIILVAFISFFFNIRNFSDRIMVNIILLLVLSTLSSSAQSVKSNTFFNDLKYLKVILISRLYPKHRITK